MLKKADVNKVIDRITHTIHNKALAEELIDKVRNYQQTHDNSDDLTNQEAALIYNDVDFGENTKLRDGKPLKIDWSFHSEYRDELRNIPPQKVNNVVKQELSNRRKNQDFQGVDKIKQNGITVVVDYDTRKNTTPAESKIVTVYSHLKSRR